MMVTPRASRLLPTGTVTFLFTDVEGSTRLCGTQHEAMAAALARHDALLRHCIEAQGGHIFKTGGDAFYATFATAASAVEAAPAAQRALCAELDQLRLLGLALVHHASGRDADSQAALQALVEKDRDGSAYQIAQGYAGRGESDLCFQWLDRAYHQHDGGLAWLKLDPLLRGVHGDPRWQLFLQKMKLAD